MTIESGRRLRANSSAGLMGDHDTAGRLGRRKKASDWREGSRAEPQWRTLSTVMTNQSAGRGIHPNTCSYGATAATSFQKTLFLQIKEPPASSHLIFFLSSTLSTTPPQSSPAARQLTGLAAALLSDSYSRPHHRRRRRRWPCQRGSNGT